ncbi:MAG: hypothetical protein QM722_08755 [Piscinibacter sp.]
MTKRSLSGIALAVLAASAAAETGDINDYLVDISGGAVSAVALVGADPSAISTIQTSQDIIVALQPLTSAEGRKGAFAVAITPARTTLLPMAGSSYVDHWYMRLLGNLTLSYAQDREEISGQAYKKAAFALDTSHYLHLKDDPVYQSGQAFKACADGKSGDAHAKALLDLELMRDQLSEAEFNKRFEALMNNRVGELQPCIDAAMTARQSARWNAARFSLGIGEGRIRPVDGGGPSYSLGKQVTLNGQYPLGRKGVAQMSLRHARDAVETASLAGAAPTFKGSSLVALRFTYGDQDSSSLRAMVEASNSRKSQAGVFSTAFMHAVGLDKKLSQGMWLEFRLGRNRSVVDGEVQTTSLMAINIAPTLFQFKK